MKITNLERLTLAGPELPVPMRASWAPGTTFTRWGGTTAKIYTDEGIVGIGSPGYGSPASFESWVKPQLIGKDPFLLEQHARVLRMANGCWGVEIALWDIVGKACNQPLYKLWGGYADRLPAYASFLEVRTPEQRAEDVLRARDEGYRAAKLRIHDGTMREHIAQAEAARKAVGDN